MSHTDFVPTHPGEVIKDELYARGISQKDFARHIGVPYTMFNDILNERRPLSAAIALLIESALGISADLLVGLQTDYNLQKAREDTAITQRVRKIQPYRSAASLSI
jgi:addiction module HigA family antidote